MTDIESKIDTSDRACERAFYSLACNLMTNHNAMQIGHLIRALRDERDDAVAKLATKNITVDIGAAYTLLQSSPELCGAMNELIGGPALIEAQTEIERLQSELSSLRSKSADILPRLRAMALEFCLGAFKDFGISNERLRDNYAPLVCELLQNAATLATESCRAVSEEAMRSGIDRLLTGVNHIATWRTDRWPEYQLEGLTLAQQCEHALRVLGAGREYDMWCCWSCAMQVRDELALLQSAQQDAKLAAPMEGENPRVTDNDKDEITVSLGGRELRGWSYANDAERRQKMVQAREYVEGWCDGKETK